MAAEYTASALRKGIGAAVLTLALAPVMPAIAHDIPADVVVQVFVKAEGHRLRVLVRAPLAAMRDVEFPLRGPGYLDLSRADASLRDAAVMWIANDLALYEDDGRLPTPAIAAARVSLPSDRAFGTYDEAIAHLTGTPLSSDANLYWNQGLLDVLFETPIASDRSRFAIDASFARLGVRVVTVVRYVTAGGAVRAFELTGNPGLVRLDPRWHEAARRFAAEGFRHILDGTDHLLFLCCLVIPFRRLRPLVLVVTAFTVAHSVTLAAAAYGFAPGGLWFPPLVETLIAVSIVYMALENIVWFAERREAGPLDRGAAMRRRWIIAFAFGLVHGFGFSFGLQRTLQFAGSHLLTSLVAFNAGVELGQLAVLVALVPALSLLFRYVVTERVGAIVASAFLAHTAWHWTLERADRLRRFEWPTVEPVIALRWTMIAAAIVMVALAVKTWGHSIGTLKRDTQTGHSNGTLKRDSQV
jgi:HupE / UreJ protein